MSLAPGIRIGPYEITGTLGAGGMGEVYRARDTRLDRFVAIKVLSPEIASVPALRERFEREARAVAALNHPHICMLYDVGQQDRTDYLVMEYLEGETLERRLKKGALPLDHALQIGIQIADALAAAHRAGIVHRDLKPGNIMLSKAGAKLLDFGLARMGAPAAAGSLSMLPTAPPGLTQHGAILGTFQYMAPEQLQGQDADARSDIFAFGAVVHEMVTGKKAFEGKSQASLIAAILERDPPAISTLQAVSPPALDSLVRTCLAKDPEERWGSAHDVRLQLVRLAEAGPQGGVPALPGARPKARERVWIAVASVLLAATVALSLAYLQRSPTETAPIRFFVFPPEGTSVAPGPAAPQVAVSPDGRRLAYATVDAAGTQQLWVRPLDSVAAQPLPGTEGAAFPFWSPDSRFIGFFAQGKLKTVDASGGPPSTVCDASEGQGGTWNRDGVIVFAPSGTTSLARVSAAGGAPTAVTALDTARRETGHLWPQFLPDDRHFLYLAQSQEREQHAIYVGSLDGGEPRRVLSTDVRAGYAPPGYLFFVREGSLMAQSFDASRLELTGEPIRVAEGIAANPFQTGRTTFSSSGNGVLAYRTGTIGGVETTRLLWFDRSGKQLGPVGPSGLYASPKLSPDETRLAVYQRAGVAEAGDISLFDLRRGTSSRFTFDPRDDDVPVWSPDGNRLIFGSGFGPFDLYQQSASGVGDAELLLQSSADKWPLDWSPDGRFILFQAQDTKTGWDLWLLPMFGDRQPEPLLQTPFAERDGQFSRDGRWIAYSSDESGRREVYVQPFGTTVGKWLVSTSGGSQPMWRRDGRELFYLGADRQLMAVEVRAGTTIETGVPRPLFDVRVSAIDFRNHYQPSADGQRFLVASISAEEAAPPITVVVNWPALLRQP